MTHLISATVEDGKDTIYIEAMVDDIIETRAATLLDPPEYGPAVCWGTVLLSEEVGDHYRPPSKELEDMLDDVQNWQIIQPDEF